MKLSKNIFFFLVFLVACNSESSQNHQGKQKEPELIEFPIFNAQFSNKATLNVIDKRDQTFRLDSAQYSNWTDKYMPFKTGGGSLYSAELYSVQPQLDNFAVLAVRTDADHWFRLHLITINKNLELVDKVVVSDSWSDLLEEAGDTEIVGKQSMYTIMLSNMEYQNIDIRTTEVINYYTDSTTYEVDSITTKIELLNDGTFKLSKLDSVRYVKQIANIKSYR